MAGLEGTECRTRGCTGADGITVLTDLQIARYSRQIILPSVGGRGQQQLLSAAVAVAGRPEMARVAAVYLAAAGVGQLFLIGEDRAVCNDLETLNPDSHVRGVGWPLTDEAVDEIVRQSSAVVCADASPATVARLGTRCLAVERPVLIGRVTGAVGEVALVGGGQREGPCFECFSQTSAAIRAEGADAPRAHNAETAIDVVLSGVIGGFIGTIIATEVIKLTLNLNSTLAGRRLTYGALSGWMSVDDIMPMPNCPVCGSREIGGTGTGADAP